MPACFLQRDTCATIKRALWLKKCCPTCRAPIKSHRELSSGVPAVSVVRSAHSARAEAWRQLAAERQLSEHDAARASGTRAAYADEVVGRRVTLWWAAEEAWFEGTVAKFVPGRRQHLIRCVRASAPLLPSPPYAAVAQPVACRVPRVLL
jgi:hypothetical protein